MKLLTKSVKLPNRVTLPYVEVGDPAGLPLILLHGYADSWHTFELVLPHLPESIHAFALTQRGHGGASRPEAGYRPRDFAQDMAAFLDMLHLEAAIIAGGSSGGFAARRFAIDRAKSTLGLVLMGSPFTLRDKPGVTELWDSTISKLTDPIDPSFVYDFQTSFLVQSVPQAFLKTLVQESLKVPARVWKATLQGLLEDDSSKDLDQIEAPSLIIWGDRDTTLPLEDQKKLVAKIPSSRLVVYSGAGHGLYWEEPERIAADLATFAKSLIN
jgi:pimeloyl-ACP methyl ester carboxylesterase